MPVPHIDVNLGSIVVQGLTSELFNVIDAGGSSGST